MPKRGQEASTFEEMQARAQKQDEPPKAETTETVPKPERTKSSKSRPNPKKRKRENAEKAEKAEAAAEGGQTNGWGKREDVKREPVHSSHVNTILLNDRSGKAQRTEERRQGRVEDRNSNTTCFACRAKGHAAKDCPNVLLAAANTDLENANTEVAGDAAEAAGPRGMKRKKGKKGAELAGSSGRCYR